MLQKDRNNIFDEDVKFIKKTVASLFPVGHPGILYLTNKKLYFVPKIKNSRILILDLKRIQNIKKRKNLFIYKIIDIILNNGERYSFHLISIDKWINELKKACRILSEQ